MTTAAPAGALPPWEYVYEDNVPLAQSSRPDLRLITAWNSSHSSTHFSPSIRSSTTSSILRCRTPSVASSERRIPLQSGVMARRIVPQSSVASSPASSCASSPFVGSPYRTPSLMSDTSTLSAAESEMLWMLPAVCESYTLEDSSDGNEEQDAKNAAGAKSGGKRRRFRKLVSSSKEGAKKIWTRGEKDPWDIDEYNCYQNY